MKLFYYYTYLIILLFTNLTAQPYYWEKIGSFNHVYDLKINSMGYIFICNQDNDFIRRSTNDGQNWEVLNIPNSIIGNLAINDSNHIFASDEYHPNNAIYKSTDDGNTWNQCSFNGGSIRAIYVSKEGYIYAGNESGIFFKSTDNGAIWDTITVTNVQINCISSASNGQIFVGTKGNGIFSSTDYGENWFQLSNITGHVTSIAINDSNYIFIANDKVRVSKDYGVTWNQSGTFGYTNGVLHISQDQTIYANYFNTFKSTDNGESWIDLGGPQDVTAIATYGDNIYLTTYGGVYRYDPDILPAPFEGKNCFPLNPNNKWQYLHLDSWANGDYYNLRYYFIEFDTLINSKKYFKLNTISDLVRYSESEKIIYKHWNDSDYVFVNFTYPPDSFYLALSPFHNMMYVSPLRGEQNIFGKNRLYGGYEFYYDNDYAKEEFTDSIGITLDIFSGYYSYDAYKLIEAILYDTNNVPIYLTEHNKPNINSTPTLEINSEEFILNFTVNHTYTRLVDPSPFSGGLNFIDTVFLKSFYSKGDTIIINGDVLAYNNPDPTNINYLIATTIDTMLMKNGYTFNYKIRAVDKGLIPEISYAPDSGYYQCIWDESTDIKENNIIAKEYYLMQNYPNPFNPSTNIQYAIASGQFVTLKVFNALGQEIETLVNEYQEAGVHSKLYIVNSALPSGVYYYQLKAGDYVRTRKMILIK